MPLEGALIFAGIVIVTGLALFAGARTMAQQALGARLVLHPETPKLGSVLNVTILARPKQKVQLDGIQAVIKCCRQYRQGGSGWEDHHTEGWVGVVAGLFESRQRSRDRETVEYDTVWQSTVSQQVGQTLQPGQACQWNLEVPIGSDGLPTDSHGNLQIWWSLTVRFEIPSFPDALLTRKVQVLSRY